MNPGSAGLRRFKLPVAVARLRIKGANLDLFLAYALCETLQKWQSREGLGDSPRIILTELSRSHSADIVLPLANGSKRELRLRCVVWPEHEQTLLLQRLGLLLPKRLHPPSMAGILCRLEAPTC